MLRVLSESMSLLNKNIQHANCYWSMKALFRLKHIASSSNKDLKVRYITETVWNTYPYSPLYLSQFYASSVRNKQQKTDWVQCLSLLVLFTQIELRLSVYPHIYQRQKESYHLSWKNGIIHRTVLRSSYSIALYQYR